MNKVIAQQASPVSKSSKGPSVSKRDTEQLPVPGKGVAMGGKTEGLRSMNLSQHRPADEMGAHDGGMKTGAGGFGWPNSPPHAGPNLETAVPGAPNDANMSAGLGPIDVPGKGL